VATVAKARKSTVPALLSVAVAECTFSGNRRNKSASQVLQLCEEGKLRYKLPRHARCRRHSRFLLRSASKNRLAFARPRRLTLEPLEERALLDGGLFTLQATCPVDTLVMWTLAI